MATKDQVLKLKAKGLSPREIADRLDCNPSYVRATLARAAGYVPPSKQKPKEVPNAAERAIDQRDLDMLCDIDEGHAESDVAKYWGVPRDYLHALRRRAKEAA